jgi:alpha/beta hydrolase fold
MSSDNEVSNPETLPAEPSPMGVSSTASFPALDILEGEESVSSQASTGATIDVAQQIQLYAPNGLLSHPLVSPALSYLGGLPPLLFIAGDREVLRDEIVYACVVFPLTFRVRGSLPAISVGLTGLRIRNDFPYARI